MGLDIYLEWENQTEEEKKAQFTGFANAGNTGYLRSSYNPSGFNSFCNDHLNHRGFYDIFQPEDYEVPNPDWDAFEERRQQLETLFTEKKVSLYKVIRISHHEKQESEYAALRTFQKNHEQHHSDGNFRSYSNRDGSFFTEGITVRAVMAANQFFGPIADTILICDMDNESLDYYQGIIEKDLKEFIALGKEKNASIIWSS